MKESRATDLVLRAGEADLGSAIDTIARAYLAAGIGAGAFLRIAKKRFALAAAREIEEKAASGKRVSVSRVAAATGLNRKEIPQLLGHGDEAMAGGVDPASFLSPSAKVIRAWKATAEFVGPNGKPKDIPYSDGQGSFCALVRNCVPDITPVSMLKELEAQGFVQLLKTKMVRLFVHGNIKIRLRKSELSDFETRLESFGDQLYKTLRKKTGAIYLDSRVAENLSPVLASLFIRNFSERARVLLDAVPKWVDANPSRKNTQEAARSIGIGIYLYEKTRSIAAIHPGSGKRGRLGAKPDPEQMAKPPTTPRAKRA